METTAGSPVDSPTLAGRAARAALPAAALAAVARGVSFLFGGSGGAGHQHLSELAAVSAFLLLVACVLGGALLIVLGHPLAAPLAPALKAAWCAAAGAGLGCVVYGLVVEPYHVVVRQVDLSSPKVAGAPLRIVHLSDLHVRRWSRVEEQVLEKVRALRPDLIVLTGDYTAFPGEPEDAWRLLRQLAAVAPSYAVRGNTDYARSIPRDTGPTLLLNATESLDLQGTPVSVTGVDPGVEWRLWELGKHLDRGRLNLGLYHYPDPAPEVGNFPYDLMLFGHTHGGQVRLPFIGALVSLSRAGTRYARGLFQRDGKSAFVSQGIGCESFGLPRLRFLCPPEIGLIIVSGGARPGLHHPS